MAADDGRALARPPRPHGAIDPVVIFVWDPTGGGKISKCMLISTSAPANPPLPKKPTPLVFSYLPWIVVGVEKIAICLEWLREWSGQLSRCKRRKSATDLS